MSTIVSNYLFISSGRVISVVCFKSWSTWKSSNSESWYYHHTENWVSTITIKIWNEYNILYFWFAGWYILYFSFPEKYCIQLKFLLSSPWNFREFSIFLHGRPWISTASDFSIPLGLQRSSPLLLEFSMEILNRGIINFFLEANYKLIKNHFFYHKLPLS